MGNGHPARDFWYFLYVSTDRKWREQHLEDCLRLYYDTLIPFLSVPFSFEEMKSEFQERRAILSGFGINVQWIALSPNKLEMGKEAGLKEMYQKFARERSAPDSEDDHPMLLELRRRTADVYTELSDLGLI